MGAKSKSKGDAAKKGGQEKTEGGKLKGGQAIKVRHILVSVHPTRTYIYSMTRASLIWDGTSAKNIPREKRLLPRSSSWPRMTQLARTMNQDCSTS